LDGFAIGAQVALLWQHNANPSYKLASIPRYDDIVRTAVWAGSARAAGRWLAGDGGVLKIARRILEVGVAGSPVIGRRRGRSQHYCGGLDCGLLWWRSGNKKRTQNVSEYMLVLALCLVADFAFRTLRLPIFPFQRFPLLRIYIVHVQETFRLVWCSPRQQVNAPTCQLADCKLNSPICQSGNEPLWKRNTISKLPISFLFHHTVVWLGYSVYCVCCLFA